MSTVPIVAFKLVCWTDLTVGFITTVIAVLVAIASGMNGDAIAIGGTGKLCWGTIGLKLTSQPVLPKFPAERTGATVARDEPSLFSVLLFLYMPH